MTATLRRTPCVGICSTTYGDLVCRGCKRFAHEIVQWNGFDDEQRRLVWVRLRRLCEGAVARHLVVEDEQRLMAAAAGYRVPELDQLTPANLAYEVLRRARQREDFDGLGIRPLTTAVTASELVQQIEAEFFERSVAQYERDFHVPTR